MLYRKFCTSELKDFFLEDKGIVLDEKRNIHASVMFVDLSGYTKLSEDMPPDVMVDIINVFFKRITRIVHNNRGRIDKFIGDCAMAVFGFEDHDAAQERRSHAIHAVKSALDILDEMDILRQERHDLPTLNVHIGINTGRMLWGCFGSEERMDFTVIGDQVNVAARLLNVANQNQILITESTKRGVGDYVVLENKVRLVHDARNRDEKIYYYIVSANTPRHLIQY